MNGRLWIKLIFVLAVLLFMVLMGMSNQDMVQFRLKPLGLESGPTSSALMYYVFFGAGVVTGAVLAVGLRRSSKGK